MKSPFLKTFLRLAGYFALIYAGVEVLNYFGQFDKPLKFMGLLGFAIAAYGFIYAFPTLLVLLISLYSFIFRNVRKSVDIELPDYEEETLEEENGADETESEDDEDESEDDGDEQITEEEDENSRKQKRTERVLAFLFVAGMVFAITEMKSNDNTINGFDLFVASSVSGLITGFICFLVWARFFVNGKNTFTDGLNYFLFLPLFTASIFFAGSNLLNRTFAGNKHTMEFMVTEKGINYRHHNRYVFIDVNGHEERLETDKVFFERAVEKEPLRLTVVTGLFGYEVVQWK